MSFENLSSGRRRKDFRFFIYSGNLIHGKLLTYAENILNKC